MRDKAEPKVPLHTHSPVMSGMPGTYQAHLLQRRQGLPHRADPRLKAAALHAGVCPCEALSGAQGGPASLSQATRVCPACVPASLQTPLHVFTAHSGQSSHLPNHGQNPDTEGICLFFQGGYSLHRLGQESDPIE